MKPDIPEDKHLRTVKSYVIRGGRLTPSQEKAIERLWTVFGLQRRDGLLNPEALFGRRAPLILEIGFGMGDSLLEMAESNPQQDFIGIDVHPPGIGNLLRGIEAGKLGNIRVFQDDARLVLQDCLAPESLDKALVFFPDPWHKKRHHKRRLVQAGFMTELYGKLKTGGVLHLATDWEHYAQQMLEVVGNTPGFVNLGGKDGFAANAQRPATKFERRGERLGHGVWDLVFEKR